MTTFVYDQYPKNIEKHPGKYKAEDWANFLHYYSLPLFKDNISDDVFKLWNEFTLGAIIATKMEILPMDIDDAETSFAAFLHYYYTKVYQQK